MTTYAVVRCNQWTCRTTVDLDDDPAALLDCGHIVCDRCVTCDEPECQPEPEGDE